MSTLKNKKNKNAHFFHQVALWCLSQNIAKSSSVADRLRTAKTLSSCFLEQQRDCCCSTKPCPTIYFCFMSSPAATTWWRTICFEVECRGTSWLRAIWDGPVICGGWQRLGECVLVRVRESVAAYTVHARQSLSVGGWVGVLCVCSVPGPRSNTDVSCLPPCLRCTHTFMTTALQFPEEDIFSMFVIFSRYNQLFLLKEY